MARTIRNAKIDSRSARAKLPLNKSGYWTAVSPGCALGYRKGAKGGVWVAKFVRDDVRRETTLGPADDALDADGALTLNYAQAQERARSWFAEQARAISAEDAPLPPYTVRECLADYVAELRRKGAKSVRDTQTRIDALILPVLGDLEIAKLTAKLIQSWQADLAQTPPRLRTRPGEVQKYGQHSDDPEQLRRRRATANRTLTILKAALNHAFAHGKVASDGAWRRVRPFREVDAARIRYITPDECRRLIDGADAEFRPLVQAALATGCRYGELVRIGAGVLFDPQAAFHQFRRQGHASLSGDATMVRLAARHAG